MQNPEIFGRPEGAFEDTYPLRLSFVLMEILFPVI
jgi:hypothetical protein